MDRLLATETSYNLQIRRGADVISRIDYARSPERLEEFRGLVLETIDGLISRSWPMLAPSTRSEIRAAFIAGNTTMTHLRSVCPHATFASLPTSPR